MALPEGARLGPFEILSAIGAGGMGEVYRARDTKLKRDVALKVLPDSFTSDPDRLARFQREAEVLASLNHPHIAQIYGFEQASGASALVMELVEGEDLSARIARGPIPLDDALPMARQIAEALEAAHEQGIIHRDLKPANIKLRPDGTVKVLDFGLAKALDQVSGIRGQVSGIRGQVSGDHTGSPANSPTITSPAMTQMGVILGTAAYMSPEQAKGKAADKRSDIWAFGCVLYEMLTSRRAFPGDEVSETLAAVLRAEPSWGNLGADVPSTVRRLLRRCLKKDPKERIAAVADVRLDLDDTMREPEARAIPVDMHRRTRWLRVAGLVLTSALLGALVAFVWRSISVPTSRPLVARTTLGLAGAAALSVDGEERDLAVTPDGRRVVYVGNNGTQLFVRSLDQLDAVAIASGRPRGVFVSPDGQWAGFFDGGGSALKKVALTGGPAITLARFSARGARGATWAPDNTIIFGVAGVRTSRGLQAISADGGETRALTIIDEQRGEMNHHWPHMLPTGDALLYTIHYSAARTSAFGGNIALFDLKSRESKILVQGGTDAQYVSTGHIVYTANGTLRAVPFDLRRRAVTGSPVTVVSPVQSKSEGAGDFHVSADGTLAYVPVRATRNDSTLAWVDRSGQELPVEVPPQRIAAPRISPDSTRIALDVRGGDAGIWLWHSATRNVTRLTVDRAGLIPVWSPRGDRVAFASRQEGGALRMFWMAADGSGTPEPLAESRLDEVPTRTGRYRGCSKLG